MSDYLSNLLSRSRGLEQGVRPRSAHPFETFGVAAAGGVAWEESHAATGADAGIERETTDEPSPAAAPSARARESSRVVAPENKAGDMHGPTVSSPLRAHASDSARAPSPAPLRQGPRAELQEEETPARAGLLRERTEEKKSATGLQSSQTQSTAEKASGKGVRTSTRGVAVQPEPDGPDATATAQTITTVQRTRPGLLRERESGPVFEHVQGDSDPHGEALLTNTQSQSKEEAPAQGRLVAPPRPSANLLVPLEDSGENAEGSRQVADRPLRVEQGVTQPRALAPAPLRPSEAQPASPAPAVRVTIGRIEVRAVMPPTAPAKKTARPGPKLSLDEYLRSQNGGRR